MRSGREHRGPESTPGMGKSTASRGSRSRAGLAPGRSIHRRVLRLSEKWFRRGLWIVAIVFAAFLTGLGDTVVRHMPRVETAVSLDQFMPQPETPRLRERLRDAAKTEAEVNRALEQARQQHAVAVADSRTAADSLAAFLATRQVTARPDQDPEVIARREAVEAAKKTERQAHRHRRGAPEGTAGPAAGRRTPARPAARAGGGRPRCLRLGAPRAGDARLPLPSRAHLAAAARRRLATSRKRQSTYWPFVWGFILFALVAFFVELVPYLPDWGGYVRYIVGIVITVLVGRWAIQALNRYLERQRAAEAMPDAQRRDELYDVALARLAKKVCPGCERPVASPTTRSTSPALRDRSVQQVRLRSPQERVRPLLPRVRQGGGSGSGRTRRVDRRTAARSALPGGRHGHPAARFTPRPV